MAAVLLWEKLFHGSIKMFFSRIIWNMIHCDLVNRECLMTLIY